jgi:hypothetical protein
VDPVSTATLDVSSASNVRNAWTRAAAVGPSTALRARGRLMITVVTGPDVSTMTCSATETSWQTLDTRTLARRA